MNKDYMEMLELLEILDVEESFDLLNNWNNRYYFEILETEDTIDLTSDLIGTVATFNGTVGEYMEQLKKELITLNTLDGELLFKHSEIKLIGCYDIRTVNTYDRCIKEIDEFEGNSTFDELLDENNNILGDAIENLKLILNVKLEELFNGEEEEEQREFYNEMLTKINTIA